MAKIHPTAVVHRKARLAENVEIGAYSVIGKNVEIGAGTKVGAQVQISGWTEIGENNQILDCVSIGLPPQDSGYQGEETRLSIGSNNVIREYVSINRGTKEGNGVTVIGNNNLFMAYSHVAHDCSIGSNIVLANSVNMAGHVEIEDGAYIAGLVGIHQFVRIGYLSMIDTHSKVTKDIPPYMEAAGHPASIRGINWTGLLKEGYSGNIINEIESLYRILYKSDLNIGQAVAKIDREFKLSQNTAHFIKFLKNSSRGICR